MRIWRRLIVSSIVFSTILMVMVGCLSPVSFSSPTSIPNPKPLQVPELPDRNIVFQIMAGDSAEGYSFGFINADGSGLVTVNLNPNKGAAVSALPTEEGTGIAILPAWSADGNTLIFRGEEHMPDITHPGRFYIWQASKGLTRCPPELTHGGGPLFITPDGQQAIASVTPELPDKLVLIALGDCKINNTFVTLNIHSGAIATLRDETTLQETNEVVFSQNENIGVLDIDSTRQSAVIIAHGIAPRWAPNGEWIAYTDRDGIYVVKRDGTGLRRVVAYNAYRSHSPDQTYEQWPPVPSWSPDGKWLVYHKCTLLDDQECEASRIEQYAIFKVNVETGIETKIADGGLNPYWRGK